MLEEGEIDEFDLFSRNRTARAVVLLHRLTSVEVRRVTEYIRRREGEVRRLARIIEIDDFLPHAPCLINAHMHMMEYFNAKLGDTRFETIVVRVDGELTPFINAAVDVHTKVVFVGHGVCPSGAVARRDVLKKRKKHWDAQPPTELAPTGWGEELIAINACSVLKKRRKRWDVPF